MDRSIIDKLEAGGETLRRSVEGLSKEDLLAHPIPGTWSIQEIVLHLVDTDQILCERIKRMIAEPNPTLLAFDESRWTRNLHYDLQSVEDALQIDILVRRQIARVLRASDDEVLSRFGVHTERGPTKLSELVPMLDWHLEHHMKFLLKKRALLGKPLKE